VRESREEILDELIPDGQIKIAQENYQPGDLIDFGAYGPLFLLKDMGDNFWVTDEVEDRYSPDASGWYINSTFAESLIEQG